MDFNVKLIEEKYQSAADGDKDAIHLLVEWGLMIISKDFNSTSSDPTSIDGNKAFAECAYSLNLALVSLGNLHRTTVVEHVRSVLEVESNDSWILHLPIGQLRISPNELIGVLYQQIHTYFRDCL